MTPDRELLERLAPMLGAALAKGLKPTITAMDARLAEAEAQIVSLRRALSTAAPGAGLRRRFTEVIPDPDFPGCSLAVLDDGSAVSLPDERLNALAAVRIAGRA